MAAGGFQSYSRDMEREADGYGLAFMTRAGYDPRQSVALWRKVIAEKEASADRTFSTLIFDSHPPSEERLEALDAFANQIVAKNRDFITGFGRYHEVLAPHRFGFLEDELRLSDFSRIKVLLDSLLDGDHNPSEISYFKGELYRQRDQAGDQQKAIDAYQQAILHKNCRPEVFRALGILYKKMGDFDQSSVYFAKYLHVRPDAVDREMILFMMSKDEQ